MLQGDDRGGEELMRTASGVLLGTAAAVGILALMPARAGAPVTIEKSLLGVRILQTYHDVLAKLGQPKLVFRWGEVFEMVLILDAERERYRRKCQWRRLWGSRWRRR